MLLLVKLKKKQFPVRQNPHFVFKKIRFSLERVRFGVHAWDSVFSKRARFSTYVFLHRNPNTHGFGRKFLFLAKICFF